MTKYRLMRVEGAIGNKNAYVSKGVFTSLKTAKKHKPKKDSDYRIVKSSKAKKAFRDDGRQFYTVKR